MATQLLIFSLPTQGQAVLSLSEPLTRESLPGLELVLAQALEKLRREVCDVAAAPGELEYASWTPLQRHSNQPHHPLNDA